MGLQSTVQYAGQAIAMILAQTQAQADAAALLVTATYTNILPPILTIAQARANPSRGIFTSPVIPPLVYGDTTAALKTAPFVINV